MMRIEKELYGLEPRSAEWTSMCEAAQRREDCQSELIPMPLLEPL